MNRLDKLKERIGNEPPIAYMMDVLDLLPGLLEVASAARRVVDCDNDIQCGLNQQAKAMDALEASLLKLEKQP